MSSREWVFRLEDILNALKQIDHYINGMDLSQFKLDQRTVDAVIRNLEVIGEAACHIPDSLIQKYSDIPWKYMKGIRNILIHEYFGVNMDIVWHTIKNDLPKLKTQIEEILQNVQSS